MAHFAMLVAGVTACVFAALMVLQDSLYVSAVCLLAVLFQSAVFFFFAGAPMLAFLQIMIYAGAVMVLVVIMIMAAPGPQTRSEPPLSLPKPFAAAVIMLPLLETAFLLWRGDLLPGSVGGALAVQSQLGPVLFGPYAVATEAVTLLMLLAGLAIVDKKALR